MSPFERYLRERLGELNPAWLPEWDRCRDAARSPLAELRQKGGDDRFTLFVLANYRWRALVLPGPLEERDALIEQIDALLGNQSVWVQHVRQSGRMAWMAAEEELRRAREALLTIRALDLSTFESGSTDWMTSGAHWRSDHSYSCLWVLDWHLKQLPRVRRIRRRLLAELLTTFELLPDSEDPERLVAQRLRRNPRIRVGHRSIRNSTLAQLIRIYHRVHGLAKEDCGPICESSTFLRFMAPVEAERLVTEAVALEQKEQHVEAARCYRAALTEAQKHLGTDHFYLAPILVRLWLALRHAGQHTKAAKVKPRVERMWEKYGLGHLSQ
jgi:hypothetical protein